MHNTLNACCTCFLNTSYSELCAVNMIVYFIHVAVFTIVPLQYVVAGVWKGFGVAIRVTKQDILDETGLQFIGDAIDILKWVWHSAIAHN